MPKVIITEKDLTSAGLVEENDSIVLIPGTAQIDGLKAGEEKYYTYKDASEFTSKVGYDKTNVACKMVYRLIGLGMTVLYRVIEAENDLDASSFWTIYSDKSRYNLRFLTTGGYTSVNSAAAMIQCAADRGDAVALVDVPDTDVVVELPLKSITMRVEEGQSVYDADGTAFDLSVLEAIGHFASGDLSTEKLIEEGTLTPTAHPDTPETTPGTYTVTITAEFIDDDGDAYPVAPLTVEYKVIEQ